MEKLYGEGDFFALPLSDRQYVVGLIGRVGKRKKIAFGFFFPEIFDCIPTLNRLSLFKSSDAILQIRFGDLGIINGEWPVIGMHPSWNKDEWRMPLFVSKTTLSNRISVKEYDEKDLGRVQYSRPGSSGDLNLPEDSLYGYGAVVKQLRKILGLSNPPMKTM